MKYTFVSLFFCFFNLILIAQNTVGLLSYDPVASYDGYNLIFPHNQPNVYLLNNCGEIVHTWTDDPTFRPGNTAYLTEDGLLYKAKRSSSVAGDAIWAGGGGATLEIRDWDNNLVWDFTMNNDTHRLHHDFAVMPNGNILAIAWELKTTDECIAAGRDTSTLAQNIMWPDWIFEINPDNDEIVWEWHIWDHLVQDFDDTKANFGVVGDHPELMDVNYHLPTGHPDWMHANAIDYNVELDQIMLSIPYFDEVWIIDHTTSTAQASGHNGGMSGRGGDLMFRWGNSRVYDQGDSTDQTLFFQHDAHWIDDFIDPGDPKYGKIAMFNNRVADNYSSVGYFSPNWDMYSWSYTMANDVFLPEELEWSATHPIADSLLWSTGLSSVQILPNGNALICSGRFGYSFELTPDNEIVWEYKTPLNMGNPAIQGDTLDINNNLTFRIFRYPTDFAAFDNRDLTSKGWIEENPDSLFCETFTPVNEILDETAFKIFPNPASSYLTVEWDGMRRIDLTVYNSVGQLITSMPNCIGGRKYLDTSSWPKGIYIVNIDHKGKYSKKIVIQ